MGNNGNCVTCGENVQPGSPHVCPSMLSALADRGLRVTGSTAAADDGALCRAVSLGDGAEYLVHTVPEGVLEEPAAASRCDFAVHVIQRESPVGVLPIVEVLDSPAAIISPWINGPTATEVFAFSQLSPDSVFALCDGVAEGVQSLHDLGVMHGYLASERIVLAPGGVPLVSGAGFGLPENAPEQLWSLVAPEVKAEGQTSLTPAADVFSVGRLLQIGLLGSPRSTDGEPVSDAPEWVLALLRDTTNQDPAQRCSLGELRERIATGATSVSGAGWAAAGVSSLSAVVGSIGGAAGLAAAMSTGGVVLGTSSAATAAATSSTGLFVWIAGAFAAQPVVATIVTAAIGVAVVGSGAATYEVVTSPARQDLTAAAAPTVSASPSASQDAVATGTTGASDDGLFPQGTSTWQVAADEGVGFPSPAVVYRDGQRVCWAMSAYTVQEWVGQAGNDQGTPTLTGFLWTGESAVAQTESPSREGESIVNTFDDGNFVITETWTPVAREQAALITPPEEYVADYANVPIATLESTARGLCRAPEWPKFTAERMAALYSPPTATPAASLEELPDGRSYWTTDDGDLMGVARQGSDVRIVVTLNGGNSRCTIGTYQGSILYGSSRSAGDFQPDEPEVMTVFGKTLTTGSPGQGVTWTSISQDSVDAEDLSWSLDRCTP